METNMDIKKQMICHRWEAGKDLLFLFPLVSTLKSLDITYNMNIWRF